MAKRPKSHVIQRRLSFSATAAVVPLPQKQSSSFLTFQVLLDPVPSLSTHKRAILTAFMVLRVGGINCEPVGPFDPWSPEMLPPVRLPKCSIRVKAKTSAPQPYPHHLRGLDTIWLCEKQPAPGVGDAVRAAADVGEARGATHGSAEGLRGDRLGNSVGQGPSPPSLVSFFHGR